MRFPSIAIILILFSQSLLLGQQNDDVIINEIGFGGLDPAHYRGGDYIELLVVNPDGVRLGGWFLTDLSSTSDDPGISEGAIQFSEEEGSVFQRVIPVGTYILVCLGSRDQAYGSGRQEEDVTLDDGNNRLVVFADRLSPHIVPTRGTLQLTNEDNVALLHSWYDEAAVDVVTWGGASRWKYTKTTSLAPGESDWGRIAYFIPREESLDGFRDNTDPLKWVLTTDVQQSTPGYCNRGVDDLILQKQRLIK